MALSPQKAREYLFQLLYSWDLNPEPLRSSDNEEWSKIMQAELHISARELKELKEKACTVFKHYAQLDSLITEQSQSYEFARIQSVEKTILRLCLYELIAAQELPPKVALAEAIRLTRKFSTAEAADFVNAILDALYKKHVAS